MTQKTKKSTSYKVNPQRIGI